MLVNKTVKELLEAFSAPTPTPGGGSAAALSGAVGASLLEMVAGMTKTRTGSAEERAALDAALPAIRDLRARLTSLIDEDARSYDEVVAAYRLPKSTDEEKFARKAAVQRAMRHATDIPLETMRAGATLMSQARVVAESGNQNARSDVSMAVSMAMNAMSGGYLNVLANLDSVGSETFAAETREEMSKLQLDAGRLMQPIMEALGWKGHEPPRG